MYKIITIMPADGYKAIYKYIGDDDKFTKDTTYFFQLAGWALVENFPGDVHPSFTSVHGLVCFANEVVLVPLLNPKIWQFQGYEYIEALQIQSSPSLENIESK